MEFGGRSSWNWMAEGFGFCEAVFFKDGLSRGRLDVCEEGEGSFFVNGTF
jgi:hypothetical protein